MPDTLAVTEMEISEQEAPLDLCVRGQNAQESRDQYVTRKDVRSVPSDEVSGPIDLRTNGRAEERAEDKPRPAEDRPRPARPHPYSMAAILGPADNRKSIKPITAKLPDETEVTQIRYNHDMMSMNTWYNTATASSYYKYPTRMSPFVWPVKVRSAPKVICWCHFCKQWLSTIYEVYRHQLDHIVNKDKCALQRETFTRYGYVTHHVYIDDNTIQCGICQMSRTVCLFEKHQLSHDGHSCSTCGKEYPSESILNDHVNIHNGDTPYKCSYCPKQFANKRARAQHERCHINEGRFQCGYCDRAFSKKYTLQVHERLHTGETPFVCHVTGCDKAYPQKVQLQNHVTKHHQVGDV